MNQDPSREIATVLVYSEGQQSLQGETIKTLSLYIYIILYFIFTRERQHLSLIDLVGESLKKVKNPKIVRKEKRLSQKEGISWKSVFTAIRKGGQRPTYDKLLTNPEAKLNLSLRQQLSEIEQLRRVCLQKQDGKSLSQWIT